MYGWVLGGGGSYERCTLVLASVGGCFVSLKVGLCVRCGSSSELNKSGQGVTHRAGVAVGVTASDGADKTTWEPASALRSLTTHWMPQDVPADAYELEHNDEEELDRFLRSDEGAQTLAEN